MRNRPLQVATQQEQAARAAALGACMQAGAVALLVVVLLALYGRRECPHASALQHLQQAEGTGGGGPGGGGIVYGHGRSSPKTWLQVSAFCSLHLSEAEAIHMFRRSRQPIKSQPTDVRSKTRSTCISEDIRPEIDIKTSKVV